MQVLLKQVKIVDPTSSLNGQIKDILIKNGTIEAIRNQISSSGTNLSHAKACVSPGWIDLGTYIGDPGIEQAETIESASRAASRGGFTALAMLPNTDPAMDSKGSINYVETKSKGLITNIHPIGALSQQCQGKDLAEMIDMHRAGALAFTDGMQPIQSPGLLLKALEYVKLFDGLILNHPHLEGLTPEGLIHEGEISVSLGIRGLPTIGEVLMLKRDIDLLRYADSRLHVMNISTAQSVTQIRAAKAEGLRISCSVPALNLLYTDEQVSAFDENFKVLPPLRSKKDRAALLEGLKDGTIDLISANHRPVEAERKNLEFAYAAFGISSLESTFPTIIKSLGRRTSLNRIIEKLAINPRQILGLDVPKIERGALADLTIFSSESDTIFTSNQMNSQSKNNPFIGSSLPGKVLGVIANNKMERF